jgi:thiosulfate/3-mercaptopyruvate sulfurtransferase
MKWVKELKEVIEGPGSQDVRFCDCRFSLGEPEKGEQAYLEEHIPGAVYFHLEKDLSGQVSEHGGRHPLPDMDEFKEKLEQAGISNHTAVIAYDGGEGAFAARLWWLLKYAGHENVYVLNGGFKEWKKEGQPVAKEIPRHERGEYALSLNTDILADTEEAKKSSEAESKKTLIDSREKKRYLGIEEPIDKKAGHIPGAVNYPWTDGFVSGKYRIAEEQRRRFSSISPEDPVIVYCGSGVTAAPNFIALKEAGYENVKLYIGSFSDWISYPENKVAKAAGK